MPKFRRNQTIETGTQLTPTRGPKKGWKRRAKQMAANKPSYVRRSPATGNLNTILSSISNLCEVALVEAGRR